MATRQRGLRKRGLSVSRSHKHVLLKTYHMRGRIRSVSCHPIRVRIRHNEEDPFSTAPVLEYAKHIAPSFYKEITRALPGCGGAGSRTRDPVPATPMYYDYVVTRPHDMTAHHDDRSDIRRECRLSGMTDGLLYK